MNRLTCIILIGLIVFLTLKMISICQENKSLELDNENLQVQIFELSDIEKQQITDNEIGVG